MIGVGEQLQRCAASRAPRTPAQARRGLPAHRVCLAETASGLSRRPDASRARATAAWPSAAESRGTRGRQRHRSGAAACACEVIRPPKDLPPAMIGTSGELPARFGHRGAHSRRARLCRTRPFAAVLHGGKLIAQTRDAAFGQFGRDRGHERMRHAGARAAREHEAGRRAGRGEEQCGDARLRVSHVDGDRQWFRVPGISLVPPCYLYDAP